MDTQKVFCLPDDYEVEDESLNDIKFNLWPVFNEKEILNLDKELIERRSLEGEVFYPGYVPINDLKGTNYITVVL